MPETTNQKSNSPSPNARNFSTKPSSVSAHTRQRPKGKSKYAKKSRVNANKKAAPAKPKGPVYAYTSACCGVPAVKKPCVAVNKKDALTQTLGKFRCGACKKRCKVTVSKYKAPEPVKAGEYTTASLKVLEGMPPATPDSPAYMPPAEVPVA